LVVKKATSWVTHTIVGLGGISLIFTTGIAFGIFRVDIMEFFVQLEQVNSNTKRIEALEAQDKRFKDQLEIVVDRQNRGG
jgi:hypothetical protein